MFKTNVTLQTYRRYILYVSFVLFLYAQEIHIGNISTRFK